MDKEDKDRDRSEDRTRRNNRFKARERDKKPDVDRIDGGSRKKPRRKFNVKQGWTEASSYEDGEAEDFFDEDEE